MWFEDLEKPRRKRNIQAGRYLEDVIDIKSEKQKRPSRVRKSKPTPKSKTKKIKESESDMSENSIDFESLESHTADHCDTQIRFVIRLCAVVGSESNDENDAQIDVQRETFQNTKSDSPQTIGEMDPEHDKQTLDKSEFPENCENEMQVMAHSIDKHANENGVNESMACSSTKDAHQSLGLVGYEVVEVLQVAPNGTRKPYKMSHSIPSRQRKTKLKKVHEINDILTEKDSDDNSEHSFDSLRDKKSRRLEDLPNGCQEFDPDEFWCHVCYNDDAYLDDPIVQCEGCNSSVHKVFFLFDLSGKKGNLFLKYNV